MGSVLNDSRDAYIYISQVLKSSTADLLLPVEFIEYTHYYA